MNGFDVMPSAASAVAVHDPVCQSVPLVFASPHSGCHYGDDFIALSRLDARSLRRSEDSFVDQLYASAPDHGAPLVTALFPRAYCDANRSADELDAAMFAGGLPVKADGRSARVAAGLGVIPKVVASGAEIYDGKLPISEIARRLDGCYHPYHASLKRLVGQTKTRFGRSLLIDCHSMPSVGGPMDRDNGLSRVDVVLGDCFGTSCHGAITDLVETGFKALGYRVVRNAPYAGGFTTRHYGRPAQASHALQIELNRAVYMAESSHEKLPVFDQVRSHIDQIIGQLCVFLSDWGTASS